MRAGGVCRSASDLESSRFHKCEEVCETGALSRRGVVVATRVGVNGFSFIVFRLMREGVT